MNSFSLNREASKKSLKLLELEHILSRLRELCKDPELKSQAEKMVLQMFEEDLSPIPLKKNHSIAFEKGINRPRSNSTGPPPMVLPRVQMSSTLPQLERKFRNSLFF
jgi:hypothetical protein